MKFSSSNRGRQPWVVGALTVVLAALTLSSAALAQRERRPAPPQWHGDIARFHEHDWHVWRGGHWVHERHDGRLAWWWVVGGIWYFYPAPVYPYPNPWEPPPVTVAPPLGSVPLAPPTQYWYYCEAARSYYPYVSSCPGGWQQVPATPSDAPAVPLK